MKNAKLKIILRLSVLTVTASLLMNATRVEARDLTPAEILRSSRKMSEQINSPALPEIMKVQFKKAKNQILNYYAAKQKIPNCQQLLQNDPTMLTGVYNLYPAGRLTAVLCEVENGRVVSSNVLARAPASAPTCMQDGTCVGPKTFYKKISCASTAGAAKTYCPVTGVYGTPVVVEDVSGQCNNENYGYDDAGFWVKSGCSGKFAMNQVFAEADKMPVFTWPYRGDVIQYRLDVSYMKDGQQVTKEKCVRLSRANSPGFYRDAQSGDFLHRYMFSGICDDKTSVNLKSNLKVRLCFSPGGLWGHVFCTPYVNGTGPIYRVVNVHSSKVMDVAGGEDFNGANIHQWTNLNLNNQRFEFLDNNDGTYTISPLHSNRCVDVSGASMAEQANVWLWNCFGGGLDNQRWIVTQVGTDQYEIKSKLSGKCLEVIGGRLEDGANIVQYSCTRKNNQRWRLIPLNISRTVPNFSFWVPRLSDFGNVMGAVESVKVDGTRLVVEGWACHIGDPGPIEIHMWHRNQYAQPGSTWLGWGIANKTHQSGSVVDMNCVSGGTAHRFEAIVPLPGNNIPAGSPIWVSGISRISGKPNTTLQNGAGVFKVPQYVGTPPLCVAPTMRCDPFNENTRRSRDHLGCEQIFCTRKNMSDGADARPISNIFSNPISDFTRPADTPGCPAVKVCDPFNENTHRSRDHLGCERVTCTTKRNGSDR